MSPTFIESACLTNIGLEGSPNGTPAALANFCSVLVFELNRPKTFFAPSIKGLSRPVIFTTAAPASNFFNHGYFESVSFKNVPIVVTNSFILVKALST